MLKVAVHNHVEDLEIHCRHFPFNEHYLRLNEYKELENMLEQLLLKE